MPAPHHSPTSTLADVLGEEHTLLPDYQMYVPPIKELKNKKNRFSFAWFFLVFWLTAVATLLISWSMVVKM